MALRSHPAALPVNEKAPLQRLPFQSLRSFLNNDVQPGTLLEVELMFLALAAGINDAMTFADYHIFSSNQTGNTALLAVGALGLAKKSVDLGDVAVSLSLFILGGFVFGQVGHSVGRRRRGWLLITNVLQTIMVFVAAALRKWYALTNHDSRRYSVVALLAFASGGQVAMARTVNIPEITTAMVTSAYIDFLVDPKLLTRHNRPRDRRLFFVLALLGGTFVGAAAYKKVEPALSIFLAGLTKLAVVPMLLFNHAQMKTAET